MDEDKIDEEYLVESREYQFPAYRYWKDGEILGDNLDIFLAVEYGDPEVIGVIPEDDHWVAQIFKDGVEQEKKFIMVEYEVGPDGLLPYSEYPSDLPTESETDMAPTPPSNIPDAPAGDETAMTEEPSDIPDVDDSQDVQVESGEDGEHVVEGFEDQPDKEFEQLPEEPADPVTP